MKFNFLKIILFFNILFISINYSNILNNINILKNIKKNLLKKNKNKIIAKIFLTNALMSIASFIVGYSMCTIEYYQNLNKSLESMKNEKNFNQLNEVYKNFFNESMEEDSWLDKYHASLSLSYFMFTRDVAKVALISCPIFLYGIILLASVKNSNLLKFNKILSN